MPYDLTIPVVPTVLSTTIVPLAAFSAIKMQNVKDPAATGGGYMDFVFDSTGRVTMLTGILKLDQELRKLFLTEPSQEAPDPTYGAGVGRVVGTKGLGSLVRPFLAETLQGAIADLKARKDQAALDQPVQDVERIGDLGGLGIQILRNNNDPRFWDIKLNVPVLSGGDPLETELSLLGG